MCRVSSTGIIVFVFLFLNLGAAAAAGTSGVTPADADTMVVRALRESLGEYNRTVQKGERIDRVLLKSPFQLIRRGTGAVSDLYSDGLKRNDINVTVDGERFTTACPNRMDTRVGQVDLLDIVTVNMSRNSAVLQSGLGGQLDFRRRLPGQKRRLYGILSGAFDHSEEFDGSLAVEGNGLRLAGRYRHYNPYTDADDRTFAQLYGYKEDFETRIFEVRGHAAFQGGDGVATFEGSEDVLFPYLLMDERTNDHYQLSGSYQGHRVYFNHTAHLMDNDLRTSAAMTDMVTDARNTMFGVVGDFYEVYARNWDADNHIIPLANPAAGKQNHMLPDVWRIGAALQHEVGEGDNPWLFLRAGIARTEVGDEAQRDLYRILEPGAELDTWSFPVGATATHLLDLAEDTLLGLSAEVSSDAPGVEQQYIATDKPGTMPDWVGNPELSDPLRATARAALQRDKVQLEVFATRIWNYPYLVKRSLEGTMYQTYAGVAALLAGANLFTSWRWFEAGVSWNWGEKTEDSSPLAEIQPVNLYLRAQTPTYAGVQGWALYQHAAGQKRVDRDLDETTTGAWNRVDLGVDYVSGGYHVSLAVDNLTNVLYTQHLSYLRSPFASGVRIFEPGRTLRLVAGFDL